MSHWKNEFTTAKADTLSKSVFHKFHLHTGNPAGPDLIVFVIRVFYKRYLTKASAKSQNIT